MASGSSLGVSGSALGALGPLRLGPTEAPEDGPADLVAGVVAGVVTGVSGSENLISKLKIFSKQNIKNIFFKIKNTNQI